MTVWTERTAAGAGAWVWTSDLEGPWALQEDMLGLRPRSGHVVLSTDYPFPAGPPSLQPSVWTRRRDSPGASSEPVLPRDLTTAGASSPSGCENSS